MKKLILLSLLLVGLIICCGCSTTYKMNENTYNEINDYINSSGKDYLEYVKNDTKLSKRDKATRETKYQYVKNLMIEISNTK